MSFLVAIPNDHDLARMQANPLMAELSQHDAAVDTNGHAKAASGPGRTPKLVHRMKHDKSILALAVSSESIFAGTQGGEILVCWNTARREARLNGAGIQS